MTIKGRTAILLFKVKPVELQIMFHWRQHLLAQWPEAR